MITDINRIKEGDIISGNICGIIRDIRNNTIIIEDFSTKSTTTVDKTTLHANFISASLYDREIIVPVKSNIKDGLCITTLLGNIKPNEVFTIVYEEKKKKDHLMERLKSDFSKLSNKVESGSVEGILGICIDVLQTIEDISITEDSHTELKKLRGYKTHSSIVEGKIQCIDIKNLNKRLEYSTDLVNIEVNRVHKLIYDRTLYIVEK